MVLNKEVGIMEKGNKIKKARSLCGIGKQTRFMKKNIGPVEDIWTYVLMDGAGNITREIFISSSKERSELIRKILSGRGLRVLNRVNGYVLGGL